VLRVACVVALLLAGCAQRFVVVDAVSGVPIEAWVRTLENGHLLVEASGYETWAGPEQARIALHPLWVRRFTEEQVGPARVPPPPCAGCPGSRSR
jgi:hypothetical protein